MVYTSAADLLCLQEEVVNNVMNDLSELFVEEGYNTDVLQTLRKIWEKKLEERNNIPDVIPRAFTPIKINRKKTKMTHKKIEMNKQKRKTAQDENIERKVKNKNGRFIHNRSVTNFFTAPRIYSANIAQGVTNSCRSMPSVSPIPLENDEPVAVKSEIALTINNIRNLNSDEEESIPLDKLKRYPPLRKSKHCNVLESTSKAEGEERLSNKIKVTEHKVVPVEASLSCNSSNIALEIIRKQTTLGKLNGTPQPEPFLSENKNRDKILEIRIARLPSHILEERLGKHTKNLRNNSRIEKTPEIVCTGTPRREWRRKSNVDHFIKLTKNASPEITSPRRQLKNRSANVSQEIQEGRQLRSRLVPLAAGTEKFTKTKVEAITKKLNKRKRKSSDNSGTRQRTEQSIVTSDCPVTELSEKLEIKQFEESNYVANKFSESKEASLEMNTETNDKSVSKPLGKQKRKLFKKVRNMNSRKRLKVATENSIVAILEKQQTEQFGEISDNQLLNTRSPIKETLNDVHLPTNKIFGNIQDTEDENIIQHVNSVSYNNILTKLSPEILEMKNGEAEISFSNSILDPSAPSIKETSVNFQNEEAIEQNTEMDTIYVVLPKLSRMTSKERTCEIQVPVAYIQEENQLTSILKPMVQVVYKFATADAELVLQTYVNQMLKYNLNQQLTVTQCDGPNDMDSKFAKLGSEANRRKGLTNNNSTPCERRKGPKICVKSKYKGTPVVSKGDKSEETEINSDDDLTDESDSSQLFECDNIVLCKYTLVKKKQRKWKIHLKHGIMHLNGKDYAFETASGEVEW